MGVRIDRAPIVFSGGPMSEPTPAPTPPTTEVKLTSARVPGWLLKPMTCFSAQERMRYALTCMQIEKVKQTLIDKKPGIRIAATDGRALCLADIALTASETGPQDFADFPTVMVDREDLSALRTIDFLQFEKNEMRILRRHGNKSNAVYHHRYTLHTSHEGNFPKPADIVTQAINDKDIQTVFASPVLLEKAVKVNLAVSKQGRSWEGVVWRGSGDRARPFSSDLKIDCMDKVEPIYVSYIVRVVCCIMPMAA